METFLNIFRTTDLDLIMKYKRDTYMKFKVPWRLISASVVDFFYRSLPILYEDHIVRNAP